MGLQLAYHRNSDILNDWGRTLRQQLRVQWVCTRKIATVTWRGIYNLEDAILPSARGRAILDTRANCFRPMQGLERVHLDLNEDFYQGSRIKPFMNPLNLE